MNSQNELKNISFDSNAFQRLEKEAEMSNESSFVDIVEPETPVLKRNRTPSSSQRRKQACSPIVAISPETIERCKAILSQEESLSECVPVEEGKKSLSPTLRDNEPPRDKKRALQTLKCRISRLEKAKREKNLFAADSKILSGSFSSPQEALVMPSPPMSTVSVPSASGTYDSPFVPQQSSSGSFANTQIDSPSARPIKSGAETFDEMLERALSEGVAYPESPPMLTTPGAATETNTAVHADGDSPSSDLREIATVKAKVKQLRARKTELVMEKKPSLNPETTLHLKKLISTASPSRLPRSASSTPDTGSKMNSAVKSSIARRSQMIDVTSQLARVTALEESWSEGAPTGFGFFSQQQQL